jgi:uncharacterized protein YuzE
MTIRYFADTDTALIDFSDKIPAETHELSESLYLDVDSDGNPVSLTIEHAKKSGALDELIYKEVPLRSA